MRSSSGMLLVLVARTQSGLQAPFQRPEQLLLGREILENRFDDDIGVRDSGPGNVGAQALAGGLPGLRGLKSRANSLSARARAGSMYFISRSCSGDREALQSAPRGDIATHDAGANHMDVALTGDRCRPARRLSRSCRKNTRTRLRDVGVAARCPNDRASAS